MIIRKISVGEDFTKSIHYVVGQQVLDKSYSIHLIAENDEGGIDIWIEKNSEVVKWKTFDRSKVSIEYKIDF